MKTWSADYSFKSLSRKENRKRVVKQRREIKFFNGKYLKIIRYYVFKNVMASLLIEGEEDNW